MSELAKAAWRLFISRRFAVGLLLVITALLLPGILLPTEALHTVEELEALRQKSPFLYYVGTVLSPRAIAGSWAFMALNALLLISTVACSIERIRNRRFKDPQSREPKYFRYKRVLDIQAPRDRAVSQTVSLLRKGRWRVTSKERAGRTVISGRKGDFGFWGSLVFHLGFLVLLFGVVLSARTRLSANLLIAEGQTVSPVEEGFTTITQAPKRVELPDFKIRLDKVNAAYKDGAFLTDSSSEITLIDRSGERSTVAGVNHIENYEGLVIMMENYGYAPTFIVRDKTGKELLNAIINLKGREPNSPDSVNVPAASLEIKTRFFPDYYEPRPRQASNRSLAPDNPAYLIEAVRKGRTLYDGPIKLGDRIKMGDYTLDFPELRKWSYLRITRDSGVLFIFWGLIAAVGGLVVRFVLHEKSMHIVVGGTGGDTRLVIAGKSRYFPALFGDEIDRFARLVDTDRKK